MGQLKSIYGYIEKIMPLHLRRIILKNILSVTIPYWRSINRHCDPRKWSNDELRKFTEFFTGNVVNVGGAEDKDKEGNFYRDYFINSNSYTIANYSKQYSPNNSDNSIVLDLSMPLSNDSALISSFDVVFTHTVLEHIYDIKITVENLCKMTKDIIITVVPFVHAFHQEEEYYHDYWRFTPYSIHNLFKEHGLDTIYISWNSDPIGNIYLFHIASKKKSEWRNIINMQNDKLIVRGPGYVRQQLLSSFGSEMLERGTIKISDILDD